MQRKSNFVEMFIIPIMQISPQASIAQSGERQTKNLKVPSSIPGRDIVFCIIDFNILHKMLIFKISSSCLFIICYKLFVFSATLYKKINYFLVPSHYNKQL